MWNLSQTNKWIAQGFVLNQISAINVWFLNNFNDYIHNIYWIKGIYKLIFIVVVIMFNMLNMFRTQFTFQQCIFPCSRIYVDTLAVSGCQNCQGCETMWRLSAQVLGEEKTEVTEANKFTKATWYKLFFVHSPPAIFYVQVLTSSILEYSHSWW